MMLLAESQTHSTVVDNNSYRDTAPIVTNRMLLVELGRYKTEPFVVSKESTYDAKLKEHFEALGWELRKVQIRNRFSGRANDLWGWMDYIALSDKHIVGIQNTSWGCRKKHIEKYKELGIKKEVKRWVANGGKAIMVSWKKVKKIRGGTAFRYEPVIENLMDIL